MSCGERDVCRLSRRASARVEVLRTNEDTLSTVHGLGASIVPTSAFARVARSCDAVGCGPWVGLREPAGIEHGHIHAVHARTPVCDATRYTLVCAVLDGGHARPTRYPPCTAPATFERSQLAAPPGLARGASAASASPPFVGQNARRWPPAFCPRRLLSGAG
jgi:hypothetical protein